MSLLQPLSSAATFARASERVTTSAVVPARAVAARKVDAPAENDGYWSITASLGTGGLSLSSAADATGRAAALTDIAALGIETTTGIVMDIRDRLIEARSPGADRNALNAEIGALKEQLAATAASSTYDGQNWLHLEAGQRPKVQSVVASVSRSGPGELAVNLADFDTGRSVVTSSENAADGVLTRAHAGLTRSGGTYAYFLLDANAAVPTSSPVREVALADSTNSAELDGMIAAVDSMLTGLYEAGASLGAMRKGIAGDDGFLDSIPEMIESAVGERIETAMTGDEALRAALQVRDQLQAAGLNMANGDMRALSDLFR
ncbi:flagellar hook associated protein [Ciceribacter ferrooxidans]|uniref:Flagellar hook associated protein n=1 Tax=Ciceribacter ferrooxidans TaxID=2509717 RepID=A0A4Q2T0K7_9HYPH|nr:flagellar hook associated protein [Ciceribacter ferrooxidans]RYC11902.1 flagellar hook associated protein [Ciceribacter ferrooxidans]